MLRALEAQFSDTNAAPTARDASADPSCSGISCRSPEELAALDIAIETLKRSGLAVEADDLLSWHEKILALVPWSKAVRPETDREALLEAQGLATRPDPASASIAGSLPPLPSSSRPAAWRSSISRATSRRRVCGG